MTTTKPAAPLDLSQFEGHTPMLSTLAHDLVTDAAHNAVPDLLHAQLVRDLAEATEEDITALLAECRAQREQLAEADGHAADLREVARLAVLECEGLREQIKALRKLGQRAIGLLEFNGVRADQYAALGEIRAALAATQGGKS